MLDTSRVEFFLGPTGAGSHMHHRGHSYHHLVHGRRKWYLLPPAHATFAQEHVAKRGLLDPSSRAHVLTCIQEPGEVLFVPYGWSASSKYLEPSIGWSTGFHFDRRFSAEFPGAEESHY